MMKEIPHLEDQWPMDVEFVVDDGVCTIGIGFVMFEMELMSFGRESDAGK